MIRIFREIKQKLIAEKKLRNYLVYAAGEIFLIVIGILIALSINNSNQKRIIRDKEQTYLVGLRDEFQTSKFKLAELIEVNKRNYDGAKQIIAFVSDENARPTEKEFSELLYNTFSSDISFNPNNSLLNEMMNSGSLKDVLNADLRIHLTNWISTLEDIATQEKELAVQREKVLDMFRGDMYSIRTIFDQTDVSKTLGLAVTKQKFSNLNLLDSMEFENNVLMFILTSYATETAHYQPLMQNLNTILELIEAEIEQ